MIYLIGGPPKCGKTTLAKKLSKSKKIPWISTDTLQCVIEPYMNKRDYSKNFPTHCQRGKNNDEKYSKYSSDKIIKAYREQAKTSYQAIDMFTICEITDGNDFILEGYHIEPSLVAKLSLKYPGKIKSLFLVKTNEKKFIRDIEKSTTPNDWIIARTKNNKTYFKIANMICKYGNIIEKESKKYRLKVLNTENDFEKKINLAINLM